MSSIYSQIKTIKNNNKTSNSKEIRKLSNGYEYKDAIIRNSEAIGNIENELSTTFNNSYNNFNQKAVEDLYNFTFNDIHSKKNIPFYDQDYVTRRDQLRNYSNQDEIENILDIMCDEIIVYGTNKYFAEIKWDEDTNIKESERKKILESLSNNFKKVYKMLGFKDENTAWHFVKKFLIDGYLSFEIIWDDEKTNIIGFKELDPISLKPKTFDDGTLGWSQYSNDPAKERPLLDAQVIFLSFSSITTDGRVSYAERLIRSFNILRIMEQSRIIWSVVNASFKTKFIIPVAGKSKNMAKQTLGSLMQSYRENINFNTESGELHVNGKPMLPFNKEYWIPEGEAGSPEIETIGGEGPDLSDIDQLEYFRNKLITVSKIPRNRFVQDDSPIWESSANQTRVEIYFERFLNRLRAQIEEILVKPTILQTKVDIEELEDSIDYDVYLEWSKYNVFEEIKEAELFRERIDIIATAKESLIDLDENGDEIRYFSSEFLVKKWLKLSDDDIKLNRELKIKEDNSKSGIIEDDV